MSTLTPRENFLRFLRNETPQWLPGNRDLKRFNPSLIPGNVARGMVIQQHPVPVSEYGGTDNFGVNWIFDAAAGGSMEVRPLLSSLDELEDWENTVTFPDLSSYDWEGCAKENAEYLNTDKLLYATIFSGYFERLISFVGFENAAVALIDEDMEESVHALLDRLTDVYIEQIALMKKYFNVEFLDFHDDWGTQRAPMFSPAVHQEMIVPHLKKLVEGAHAHGVYLEQHSCGLIEPLIPGLISTGIDTWRGQAVNDKKMLVDKYGDRFKFGVELRVSEGARDDEVAAVSRQVKEDFAGKRVWIFMARTLTPPQRELAWKILSE